MSKSTPFKIWGIFILIIAALVIGILAFMLKSPPPPEDAEEAAELTEDSGARDRMVEALQQGSEMSESQNATSLEPPVKAPPSLPPMQVPEEVEPRGPFAESPDLKEQERIKIDPPMMEIGKAWMDGEERSNFTMPVTGGVDLEIEVERFESIGEEAGVFIGTVKGRPGSEVNLSYRGRAEAGTIRIPTENRLYRVLPSESGSIVVQERDLAAEESKSGQPPLDAEIPPAPNFTPPPPPSEILESSRQ